MLVKAGFSLTQLLKMTHFLVCKHSPRRKLQAMKIVWHFTKYLKYLTMTLRIRQGSSWSPGLREKKGQKYVSLQNVVLMCVYCSAYLSYALDTMKMSLKTREKETSLTPCLRTTLWPRELIEFPEYLITSFQTVKESLRTSRGTKSYADIESGFFLFMERIFVAHCWPSKWAIGLPWTRALQAIPREYSKGLSSCTLWKSPKIRPEWLSGECISLPFIISKQKSNFSPF